MFRIIIAPLVWVVITFCTTGLIVTMLYRSAAIEGKIPIGFVLLGVACERPTNRILTGDLGLLLFFLVSELAFTEFFAAALLAADCIDLPFAIRMDQKPAVW